MHSLSDSTVEILVFAKWWGTSPNEVGQWPIDDFRDALEFMDIQLDLEAERMNKDPNKLRVGEVPWTPDMMDNG